MTPQPEESPDEILARRIEGEKQLLIEIRPALTCGDEFIEAAAKLQASETKENLAMLEAMRAARQAMKALVAWDEARNYLGEPHKAIVLTTKAALRQSDDAIRGMRG